MSNLSFSNKTAARDYAFKFIYRLFLEDFSSDLSNLKNDKHLFDQTIAEFEDSYSKLDEEHVENDLNPSIQAHGQKLIQGFMTNSETIVAKIEQSLQKRSINSVGNIEKAVLCLGVFELLFEDTPNKVVINEYLNLVKKYGTKESSAFVNGVLDKIQK